MELGKIELPQSWSCAPIGQLIELNPKTHLQDEDDVGFVPMPMIGTRFLEPISWEKRPWKDVKKGYTHFQDGDVLLAKITPCFENGKGALVGGLPNGAGAGSTEYFVCRPLTGFIEARYLHAYFKTPAFMEKAANQMSGSVGHKRVPKEQVIASIIPIAPLAEQKRIADKLEAVLGRVDACRARLDRVPDLLKRFRQSVLAAATSGRLTEDWREEDSTDHWQMLKVRDVGSVQLGRQRAPKYHHGQNMRPYLRVQNVFEARLDLSDVMEMEFSCADFERYKLSYGDILLNEGQSPQYLGRPAMYRDELPGACFTNSLIRFRANQNVLDREYALLVFRHYMRSGRFAKEGSITTNIAHLSAGKFANIEFALPPLPEQHEIVRRVEALFTLADRIEARVEVARAQVDRLTPAVLAKAFRGALVPQDPADEPASELLARLRRQSEAVKPVRRGRRSARVAETAAAAVVPVAASASASATRATPPVGGATPAQAPTRSPIPPSDQTPEAPVRRAGTRVAVDPDDLMALLRAVVEEQGACDRSTAIELTAYALGYQRVGKVVGAAIDEAIRLAVQRRVLVDDGDALRVPPAIRSESKPTIADS